MLLRLVPVFLPYGIRPDYSRARIKWVFQPDILIMLKTDSAREHAYSSQFGMENTTGGGRVPGSLVRY
jgi:hypothetical protein